MYPADFYYADGVLGYVLLSVSLVFEALGVAVLSTLRESLVAIHVDPEERSVIMALLQTTVMMVSVPLDTSADC